MNKKNGERNRAIIQYSIMGIAMNLILAVFKISAGIAAHAHAVMLDGINSLSDMISSLLTLLSSYIAGRRGTKDHPLGYGRLEYISSLLVTMIVMYIGVITLIRTIKAIIHPHDPPQYSALLTAIMIVSLACKTVYGVLMRRRGRALNSAAMIMTGTESLGDAMISLSILAAIVIYRAAGVDVEHWLCIIIALMILHTGADMIRECVTKILGTRLSDEERRKTAAIAAGFDEVLNVSNLILHNYGEGCYVGSLDIEVDENLTAAEISRLTRRIIRSADEQGVTLTSVGISSVNTTDPEALGIWDEIIAVARKHEGIKRAHSLMMDKEENVISFAVVPDYSVKRREDSLRAFTEELEGMYPGISFDIREEIDM